MEVERKTKEGATYGSFRIKVNKKDLETCLKDESWPTGWRIRRFFRNYKAKKIDNEEKLKKEIEVLQSIQKEKQLKEKRDNAEKLKKEIEDLQLAQKEKQLQAQRDKLVEKVVMEEAKVKKEDNRAKEIEDLRLAQKKFDILVEKAKKKELVEKAEEEAKKQQGNVIVKGGWKKGDTSKVERIRIKLEMDKNEFLSFEERAVLSYKLFTEWETFFDEKGFPKDITEIQKVRKERLLPFLKVMSVRFQNFTFTESKEGKAFQGAVKFTNVTSGP